MSKHSPSPSFPKSMLSHDYPKLHVASYEETMPLSTSSLWFSKFQPFALHLTIFHPATLAMLCYP
jgi:hypothetical protein